MSDTPYSPREIDHFVEEMKIMWREHQDDDRRSFGEIKESIDALTVEVKKTNGSVRGLQQWKSFINGGMSVLTFIVVPVLAWALWVLVNIQGQVHDAVDAALSAYTIENENR